VSTYVCEMYLNPKLVRTYIQVGGEIYVCVAQKSNDIYLLICSL